MSGLAQDQLRDLLDFASRGDEEAKAFLGKIASFARETDDIADGDVQDAPAALAYQFDLVFMGLANDPFYLKWKGAFTFLLPVIVLLWAQTDRWKKHENRNVRISGYVYRESIEFMTFVTAYIVGGAVHAARTMDRVMLVTRTHRTETFEDWEAE